MAALFQRAQRLGERPLQPGEVVTLAVMVGGEPVGPADRGVPHVVPVDPRLPADFGLIAAASIAGAATFPGVARAAQLPVNYDFIAGAVATALAPDTPPPGANNFSCKPGAAHPYPVVLVHGTFANMDDNRQAASPVLANHGYCVFAFNYGGASATSPISPVRVPCLTVLPVTGPVGPVPSF
jgi:hypothetical protein